MLYMNPPLPAAEVVAQLSTTTSRCEIRKRMGDDEAGDPIEVQCGKTTTSLGRALKGVSVDRIRTCHIVLTVNAVHTPQLFSLNNCKGRLTVLNIGSEWTDRLERSASIKPADVEFTAFEKIMGRRGCYNVGLTYDATAGGQDTSYKEKKGSFCVSPNQVRRKMHSGW